jgi:hypothetical protein
VGVGRGELVSDRGGCDAVGRVELAQDVRDVHAGSLHADDELGGDFAVGESAGDEREDLRLAPRQTEVRERVGGLRSVGGQRRGIEARPRGEQLELAQQWGRAEPRGDGVRRAKRRARLDAGGTGADERLGLAQAAIGRQRRTLESLPRVGGVGPPLGPERARGTVVLGLGEGEPAADVRGDGLGLDGGAAGIGQERARPGALGADGVGVATGSGERGELGLRA